MLVLTRKRSESIVIGNDIRITVLLVSGGKVRLGIEAPDSLGIVRQELVPKPSTSRSRSFIEALERGDK
jgi:carbon storage regulator